MLECIASTGDVVTRFGCTLNSLFGRPDWKASTARPTSGSHRNGKFESEWAAENSEHDSTTECAIENSDAGVSLPVSE